MNIKEIKTLVKYIYVEGDYNCDKCGVLGDFNGGGTGEDGIERKFIYGGIWDMEVEYDEGNSRDIFHEYRGNYCDDCLEEIVNNYKKDQILNNNKNKKETA